MANNRISLVFSPAIEKLEIVECDLEKDPIVPALGNASVVICCIGASEKEVFDITGPYRIDYQATKNLVDAGKKHLEFEICKIEMRDRSCEKYGFKKYLLFFYLYCLK